MSVFGAQTPCSSTKGYTGHTLGAAGIVEAVFSLLAIEHGLLPASVNTRAKDPLIRGAIVMQRRQPPVRAVFSNARPGERWVGKACGRMCRYQGVPLH